MFELVYAIIFDNLEDLNKNYTKFFDIGGSSIVLQDKNALIISTKKYTDKVELFKEITHRLIDLDHYQLYNINEERTKTHEDNEVLDNIINFLRKRGLI